VVYLEEAFGEISDSYGCEYEVPGRFRGACCFHNQDDESLSALMIEATSTSERR
jgi:hypothetical protein